jgi:hypothetical protein
MNRYIYTELFRRAKIFIIQIIQSFKFIISKMLSRVAHSLYWMARYIERAENIARIVDVNLQLLLDLRNLDEERLANTGCPSCRPPATRRLFSSCTARHRPGGHGISRVPAGKSEFHRLSPSARRAKTPAWCATRSRSELWEELNRLYLFVRSPQAREVWRRSPSEFFQEIKAGSLHLIGIINATMIHNEGWWFVQVGKFLERADKTTRILDVRYERCPNAARPKASARPRRSNGRPCCARAARGTPTKRFTARMCIRGSWRNFFCSTTIFRARCAFAWRIEPRVRKISGVAEGNFATTRKSWPAGCSPNCSSAPLTKFLNRPAPYLDERSSS